MRAMRQGAVKHSDAAEIAVAIRCQRGQVDLKCVDGSITHRPW